MNIKVNNIELNYEEYGEGKPIILLHGNGESLEIFDVLIENLKKDYKVYAIDSRCHGKSEKTSEISYTLMRDDIIDFIKEKHIIKPILYGFSDGGIIGLLIAIKEPNILDKLIVSGVNLYPKGIKTWVLLWCKFAYYLTRNKLVKMMIKEPNITINELNKIIVPTYILAGENDVIKLEHTKLIAKNITNCQLEIINNENHSSYIIHSEKIYNIIKKYL